MGDLFVLGYFDKDSGEFVEYVRKGRNNSITGYDNFESAKRGKTQSERSYRATLYDVEIISVSKAVIVDGEGST